MGAISQHCSQTASPGTACTNTCSFGGRDTSTCLFAYSVPCEERGSGAESTPLCRRFLRLYTFGAREGERSTCRRSLGPIDLSRSFTARIINELTPGPEAACRASPPYSALPCTGSKFRRGARQMIDSLKRRDSAGGKSVGGETTARRHKEARHGSSQEIINTEESK